MEKVIFGVSYGATIVKFENLKEFINIGIDLIEIPIIEDTERIIDFCIKNDIKVSFHMPNSYDSIHKIENKMDIDLYIKMISDILKKYKKVNIEYIIVHFPFINSYGDGFNYNLEYAIDSLELLKKKHQINIYIENVSINEAFFSEVDYSSILKNKDIQLCYDLGHANVIKNLIKKCDFKNYVDAFFNILKDNIECIHYYNTPNIPSDKYKIGEHYPFIKFNDYNKYGFMDYNKVQEKIVKLPNLKYIIMEVRRKEYIKYNHLGDYSIFQERSKYRNE